MFKESISHSISLVKFMVIDIAVAKVITDFIEPMVTVKLMVCIMLQDYLS